MKLREYALLFICFLYLSFPSNVSGQNTSVKNIDYKVDSLMKLMTLDEKIGQLNQLSKGVATGPEGKKYDLDKEIQSGNVGSLLNLYGADSTYKYQKMVVEKTRLKIPMIFGHDVIHGARTGFPIPLAEAASWDLQAIELSARIAATESAAMGLHWTFAPMVDICRDPRWGRIMEGAGEDPYLGSAIAKARVVGLQGQDLAANNTILACVKHFAGYGAVEAGREYNTTTISIRHLRETILPPFKAAVEAGAGSVMNAFNDVDGIPASGSKFLVTDVLKKEWGFKGYTVSDWNSIGEMVSWGTSKDAADAARQAMNAGSDMDMCGFAYRNHLKQLIKEGKVLQSQVDESVRRVLNMKFSLGLFEDPYRYSNPAREKETLYKKAHTDAAREVAKKSIVLLKNEKHILPISKKIKSILVVGEVANNKWDMSSTWSGMVDSKHNVTILEGIKAKVDKTTKVYYTQGADPKDEKILSLDSALVLAKKCEVIVMTIGERAWWVGENNSYAGIDIRKNELALMNGLLKTGKPLVILLTNGRPIIMNEVAEKAPSILETWWLGSMAGHAIADVLFGDYNPSGKLPVTFPRVLGQIPLYYSQKNTGRPAFTMSNGKYDGGIYRDVVNTPLYPFGFGLSYTTFNYDELKVISDSTKIGLPVTVTVKIKNTGKVSGEEVVQLYIRDMVASASQPIKVLKGFKKVPLAPNESTVVSFTLTPEDLSIWDREMVFRQEPGEFKVMVGGDSDKVITTSFYVK
ncbi:MAG TPA: beta-glucosidase BglX [Cytophagaceae bacterium]